MKSFNIALIGEVSSGKSAFLNAFATGYISNSSL
jgi:GTPase SAR1 family protein